jgi:hypothetical protein
MRRITESVVGLIVLAIVSFSLSGCLISYSPKVDSIEITPNEPMQFSVVMKFPTPSTYEWYFQRDGETPKLINGATTAEYNLIINDVLGFEGDLIVIGGNGLNTWERKWHIIYPGTNRPPVAKAGSYSCSAFLGKPFTLNGSESSDPDNNIASFKWEQVSGPETVTLTTPNKVTTQFTPSVVGNFVFKLTVTDAGNLSDYDDAPVTSDIFRSITITDPTWGEEWDTDDDHSINWTSIGLDPQERLEIILDYHSDHYFIDSDTPNDGEKDWDMEKDPWDDIIKNDDRAAWIIIRSKRYPCIETKVQFQINHKS